MSNLVSIAQQLGRGEINVEEAGGRARATTAGSVRDVGGKPSKVVPTTAEIEAEFSALAGYLNKCSYEDLDRWAGALVMIHARLGLGDQAGAVELALRVSATDSQPEGAPEFVVAMIDAVLAESSQTPDSLVAQLLAARRKVAGQQAADRVTAVGIVVDCFESQGWQYVADREAGKVMIEFTSPLGRTRLVCNVSESDDLTVFAVEVVVLNDEAMDGVAGELGRRFAGVRAERDPERGMVTLYYTLMGASLLTQQEVYTAIVLVNGAAEYLMVLAPQG